MKHSERRGETDPQPTRETQRDVRIAVDVELVALVEHVLYFDLETFVLREHVNGRRVRARVTGQCDRLLIVANMSERQRTRAIR